LEWSLTAGRETAFALAFEDFLTVDLALATGFLRTFFLADLAMKGSFAVDQSVVQGR
jgi:hypothetical protein